MNEPMSKVQKAPACSNGAIGTHASNQVDEINSIEKDFEKLKTDSLINWSEMRKKKEKERSSISVSYWTN